MLKNFIQAARLRTLPLSVSGIILGSFLAYSKGYANIKIVVLALLTTIGFQIVSNFANDYGDGVKGTDNQDRIGPQRALQSGAIQPKQMLQAIIITSIITLIIALLLIYVSFGKEHFLYSLVFFILGIASIGAAIKYTMGKNAYGYSGLGDVFVFLFFGLLSVCGTYFLFTKQITVAIFYPAFSIGLLSAAVLNLNNMRDIDNDKVANKNTLVVKIGSKRAKTYHYSLLILSLFFALLYTYVEYQSMWQFLFLIAYLPLGKHFVKVIRTNNPKNFDPELKKVALSTFLFAVLFGIGLVL